MRLPQAPPYTDHERLVLDAVTQRAHPFWEATKSEFAEAVGLPSGPAEAALHKLVAEVRVGRIAVHSRGSGEWRTPVRRFFRVWNDARVVPFIRPCARCGSMGTHRQGCRLKMFVKPALACSCAKWTDGPAPCGLHRKHEAKWGTPSLARSRRARAA
jgi:hypothetical protein